MELKEDNHFDALSRSFIYFLWFIIMDPQRGKDVSGKKGKGL